MNKYSLILKYAYYLATGSSLTTVVYLVIVIIVIIILFVSPNVGYRRKKYLQ